MSVAYPGARVNQQRIFRYNRFMVPRFLAIVLLLSLLAGCSPVTPSPITPSPSLLPPALVTVTPRPLPSGTASPVPTQPSSMPENTITALPSATIPPQASGPDSYPPGVNPLTGLPVKNPEMLDLPPALISVTNSPVTARPQMGISSAAWVFEIWIGEGVTRFLSVFYGDYPRKGSGGEEAAIGPIRSGRLSYEPLRKLFRGFLMMAFASKWVMPNLDYVTNVINEDLLTDINGAHVHVSELRKLAGEYRQKLGKPSISGMRFDPQAPSGGKPAPTIWMEWSWLSQVWWRYDAQRGAYLRWQDKEDGKTFVQAADRLTGEPLQVENLVVLFADHKAFRPELIDINFLYIKKLPALVFRDGQLYPVYWTTASETYERTTGRLRPVRFIDAQGNPFPLKPGHTWVNVMTTGSPWYETVDSKDATWLATKTAPGSGIWAVRYSIPVPIPTEEWMSTPTRMGK